MNEITTHDFGLMRRELRDARAISTNVDIKLTRLLETAGLGPRRDGSLVTRLAVCQLLGKIEGRSAAAVAQQNWPRDTQLRTAMQPAQTTVAGWAAELVGTVIGDISSRLLAPSVFSQLRALGLSFNYGNGVTRAPNILPVASGSFIAEGAPIGVGALVVSSMNLVPKKCASILAATKELLRAGPASLETSMTAILSEDLGLLVDNVLLDAVAADTIRPAGLRNGVAALTPSTAGNTYDRVNADVRAMLDAIRPALKRALICAVPEAASAAALVPWPPSIPAPFLPSGTVIAIDCAAFASIVGPVDVSASEEAEINMSDTPLPLIGGTAQPPAIGFIAAPQSSMFQAGCLALRSILDVNWSTRRPGSVAWMQNVGW